MNVELLWVVHYILNHHPLGGTHEVYLDDIIEWKRNIKEGKYVWNGKGYQKRA